MTPEERELLIRTAQKVEDLVNAVIPALANDLPHMANDIRELRNWMWASLGLLGSATAAVVTMLVRGG